MMSALRYFLLSLGVGFNSLISIPENLQKIVSFLKSWSFCEERFAMVGLADLADGRGAGGYHTA